MTCIDCGKKENAVLRGGMISLRCKDCNRKLGIKWFEGSVKDPPGQQKRRVM